MLEQNNISDKYYQTSIINGDYNLNYDKLDITCNIYYVIDYYLNFPTLFKYKYKRRKRKNLKKRMYYYKLKLKRKKYRRRRLKKYFRYKWLARRFFDFQNIKLRRKNKYRKKVWTGNTHLVDNYIYDLRQRFFKDEDYFTDEIAEKIYEKLHKKHKKAKWRLKNYISTLKVLLINNYEDLTKFFFFRKYFYLNVNDHSEVIHNTFSTLTQLSFEMYLKKFFNTSFRLKTYNLGLLNSDDFITKLTLLYRKKVPKKLNYIYLQDIIDLIYCAFYVKDVFILKKWLRGEFEKKSYKLIHRLFFFCHLMLYKLSFLFKTELKLLGFKLEFYGKISKGGSRKKKRKFFWGKNSLTTKSLRLNYFNTTIRTISGSISCKLKIFY